jgi:hypothetical protein
MSRRQAQMRRLPPTASGQRGATAIAVAFVCCWLVVPTTDSAAGDDARRIAEETQKRAASKSQRYEGLLQVFSPGGKTAEKRWTINRIGSHGLSRSVIRFTAPAEVNGVALLVHNYPDRASDQWMWTPAIERDRRIALQDRSTRFFGTDFTFEDLEERDVDQFLYAMLPDDTIDGAPCWRIVSVPRETKSSQYTKSVIWIRKGNFAVVQLELYVNDEIVRRLRYSNFRNIQGIWTARELAMADLRRGSITRLALDKIEYNVPLKLDSFTLQALRRP